MKLFHSPRTRSMRVLWMLEEMGLDCEVVNAGFPPKDAEFAAANPTGTLPLLIDGDVRITESIAILQYLAGRYGPTDLAVGPGEAGFADYLQFLEVGEASLAALLTSLVRTRFLAPADQKANWTVENTRAVYLDRLKLVAAQLERGPFMAAGRFTAADISVGYALGFGEGLKLADGFPAGVLDYWRGLQARAAYQRAAAR